MESSKEENSFRWSIVQGEGEIIKSCSIDGRNAKAGTNKKKNNTKRYKKEEEGVLLIYMQADLGTKKNLA